MLRCFVTAVHVRFVPIKQLNGSDEEAKLREILASSCWVSLIKLRVKDSTLQRNHHCYICTPLSQGSLHINTHTRGAKHAGLSKVWKSGTPPCDWEHSPLTPSHTQIHTYMHMLLFMSWTHTQERRWKARRNIREIKEKDMRQGNEKKGKETEKVQGEKKNIGEERRRHENITGQ